MSGISRLSCNSMGEWCVYLCGVCSLQWASSKAAPNCSAEDTRTRSPASASPMRTSQTRAITLPPRPLASPAKSPAAFLGASSNAFLSARLGNRKASLLLPTEERALWIIDHKYSSHKMEVLKDVWSVLNKRTTTLTKMNTPSVKKKKKNEINLK